MFDIELTVFVSIQGVDQKRQLVRLAKIPFAPTEGLSIFIGTGDHGAYFRCDFLAYDLGRGRFEAHHEYEPLSVPEFPEWKGTDWETLGFRPFFDVYPDHPAAKKHKKPRLTSRQDRRPRLT